MNQSMMIKKQNEKGGAKDKDVLFHTMPKLPTFNLPHILTVHSSTESVDESTDEYRTPMIQSSSTHMGIWSTFQI